MNYSLEDITKIVNQKLRDYEISRSISKEIIDEWISDQTQDIDKIIYEYSNMKTMQQIKAENSHKVFLGGTCNESKWRDELIGKMKLNTPNIQYFNPVVEDWTPECQAIEIDEKANKCDIHLYVITNKMKGVFSIAEAIESVFNKDKKTIFCVLDNYADDGEFPDFQLKSLKAVGDMVVRNGGTYVTTLDEVINALKNI